MKKQRITIKLLQADEMKLALPILSIINPSLTQNELLETLQEMIQGDYRCVIAYYDEKLVGVMGLWLRTKFYIGKHVEYDNFFVLPLFRGRGIGHKILEFSDHYARDHGCVATGLICDSLQKSSILFWEKKGYSKIGFQYHKSVSAKQLFA